MMKRIAYALTGLVFSGLIAWATTMPLVPSTGQYSEPSQIVGTMNALVQQLNGNVGYAPAQVMPIGSYGTISGATPQILNTQRGIVSFTGVATLATGAVTTVTLTNSLVTASSACFAQVQSGGAAGSGPYISTVTPTAGSLAMILANGGTTATGAAATFAIGFNCVN